MPYPKPKGWEYKQVANLLGGLNITQSSEALADEDTITLNNVLLRGGKIKPDTGYKNFGQVVVGTPQADYEFVRLTQLVDLMLITTATVYKYESAFSRWHLVKGTAGTTTTSSYAAGATVIAVASAAGFSTGDLVSIALDNGDQHQTTITISGLNFTLAAAIPVGRSVANGAIVNRAVALTGSLDLQVSIETIPGSDWMVFTNGVDIVKRYNGTDCVNVPNLPSAGNTICKAVVLYNTALFLLNTTEGGVAHPQRVRRSNQTDPTDWTTGTAGYDDLLDDSSIIKCGYRLGPYLIIYRERSISRGSFVGNSGLNYVFETTVSYEGVPSSKAVAQLKEYHIFVGQAGVYEYRGDYTITPIGQKINIKLFGAIADANPSYISRMFTLYVKELDEVWILYVSTNASTSYGCDRILRYNIDLDVWYTRELINEVIGSGTYKTLTTTIWSTLVGNWPAQTWVWGSRQTLANSPNIHLMSRDANQVYEYDFTYGLDISTPIAYTIETKDFAVTDHEFRFDMIEALIQGTSVLIEYSTDSGMSWDTIGTITSATQSRNRLHKQIVCNRIRFRFSGSSTDFLLTWFAFLYKPESIV